MADRIKGITIEIGGDTTKLQTSLKGVDKQLRDTQSTLKDVNKLLKLDPANTELLTQKQKNLESAISGTKERLEQLKAAQSGVEQGTAEWDALQREIIATEQNLRSLEQEHREFGSVAAQQIKYVGEQMKEYGEKMTKVGKELSTKVSAPIVAGFTAATKVTADFDSAMSEVYATMGKKAEEMVEYNGETVTSMEALRDFAREMGATTAFSASEAAQALNYMALAGYDAETSMTMLPTVLDLAAAGNIDLARASDMVTDTQTAFGVSIERTAQMVDEMAKASSTGNTSVEQLGEAFLTVGGLAQELNGGLVTLEDGTTVAVDGVQELEIALTAMANAGVKGGEAGTHMRNMLLKLSSPTKDGAARLEAMGVAVYDTEGKMRSLSDIFGDLNGKLDTMTQQEKIEAISDLFNTRDLASAEALLTAVGSDWDAIGAEIIDANGAASAMADTKLDNLNGQITILKSAIQELAISMGDTLMPSIRKVVTWVQGLVDKFNKLSPETKSLISKIALVVAAVGPALVIGGKIISMIGTITTVIGTVVGVLGGPLTLAITALIAIGTLLYANWDKIVSWWSNTMVPKFKAAGEELRKDWERIKETGNRIKEGIVTAWTNMKESVSTTVEGLKEKVSSVWDGIKEKISSVVDSVKRKIDDLKEKFNAVKDTISRIWDSIVGFFTGSVPTPHIPLPHFQIYPPGWRLADLLHGSIPSLGISWYKKAYDNPVMFTSPTVLQTPQGYKGFGDGHGAEIVMGLNKLRQLVGTSGDVVINVYATPGQNVDELADKIQQRFVALQKQKEAAYA